MAKVLYPELTCELIDLDAATARKLLEQNRSNRPFRPSLAKRYMNQMLSGQWRSRLPITVVVDRYGNIHNAQHCMNALVWAEDWRQSDDQAVHGGEWLTAADWCARHGVKGTITVKAVVIKGIHPDDANYLDLGQKRTHGDVVFRQRLLEKIEGLNDGDKKKIANQFATAAKIVYFRTVFGKNVRSPIKFEHPDMLDTEEEHPNLIESAIFVYQTDKNSRPDGGGQGGISSRINVAYLMAAHYLAWHSDAKVDEKGELVGKRRKLADQFVDDLANGVPAAESKNGSNAVHVLREWLVSTQKSGDRNGDTLYNAVVLAFNAFVSGEKITARNLKAPADGSMPIMGGIDTPPPPEPEWVEEAVEETTEGTESNDASTETTAEEPAEA